MANNDTIISILLPSRGRREVLKESILTLIENASNPKRLELLLGLDADDEGVQEYIKDNIAPILKEHQVECRANIFEPLGYENLHTYVNTLASNANGKWLMFWNDDGLMKTKNWDNVITEYDLSLIHI